MALTAREAGEQVGKTRQAIIKAIKKGTISAEKDEAGEWRIEPVELFRVYPPLPEGIDASVQTGDDETSRTTSTDERNGLMTGDNSTSVVVAELEA